MFRLLGDAVGAAYHVVSAYAQVLAPLTGSLATVAAIIAFTVSVRLLLLPLSLSAARGQASQARLLPQVAELRKRHARNPELLRAELAALYQRENTSSLAGCLPALLQLPFFSVMYRLFLDHTVNGTPNSLLSHDLLGAPLGSHWLGGPGPFSAQGAVFLGLLGLLGLVAWFSARLARQAAARSDTTAQSDAAVRPGGAIQPGGRARPASAAQSGAAQSGAAAPPATAARSLWAARRSGQAAQPTAARPAAVPGWLTRLLPYTTVVIAAIVPLAAGIYLLTTTAWTTAERALLRRRILPSGIAGPGRPGSALA